MNPTPPPKSGTWESLVAEVPTERPALRVRSSKPLNPAPTPDPVLEGLIREGISDLRAVGVKPTGGAIVRYVRLRGGHRRGSLIRFMLATLLASDGRD